MDSALRCGIIAAFTIAEGCTIIIIGFRLESLCCLRIGALMCLTNYHYVSCDESGDRQKYVGSVMTKVSQRQGKWFNEVSLTIASGRGCTETECTHFS